MARVVFEGADLEGFVSGAPDDHVKVLLPVDGQQEPTLPTIGPDGPVFPEGAPRPHMRDYTPLHFDAETRTLVIEFALHGDGPGASWAARAKPGDVLGIGGPGGSLIVPYDFAGYLLLGDESSLPAITRRLAELPADVPATVIVEVEGPEDERQFVSAARLDVRWLHRNGRPAGDPAPYVAALRAATLPPSPFYAWVLAEESVVHAARRVLLDEQGIDKAHMLAKAYWTKR